MRLTLNYVPCAPNNAVVIMRNMYARNNQLTEGKSKHERFVQQKWTLYWERMEAIGPVRSLGGRSIGVVNEWDKLLSVLKIR